MLFEINPFGSEPIYKQLCDQIILGIAKNQLPAGTLLPSVRSLADELGVNPMTVSKAYHLLKEDGYLMTDRRNGTVITQQKSFTPDKEAAYSHQLSLLLAEGYLHQRSKENILKEVEYYLNSYEKGANE
ncbi:GntR family transcriptional regulator [Enterococcus olivae]